MYNIYKTNVSTSEINSLNDKKRFHIYPNPVCDNLYITGDIKNNNDLHYSLFDLTGKIILSKQFESLNTNVNTSTLNKGMYFLSINGKNISETIKIIKE